MTVTLTIVGTTIAADTPADVVAQVTQNVQAVSSCQSDASCRGQMVSFTASAVGSLTVSAVEQQFPTSVVKITDSSAGGTAVTFAVVAVSFTVQDSKPTGVTGVQAVDFQVKTSSSGDGTLTAVVTVTAAMIRLIPQGDADTYGAVNRRSARIAALQAASSASIAGSNVDLYPGLNTVDIYNKKTGALIRTMEITRATTTATTPTLLSTSSSSNDDAAAIGGGIGGALAGLLLIGVLVALFVRHRNNNRQQLSTVRSGGSANSFAGSTDSQFEETTTADENNQYEFEYETTLNYYDDYSEVYY